jgi:hypothetical protein
MFKTILTFFFLVVPVLAQDPAAASFAAAGCGSNEIQFDVKTDKKLHPLPQPEPGKALVYVFEDKGGGFCIGGCITTRVGVDGAWVGANQGNSYLFFSVEPGEHRVCTAWQSSLKGRSEVSAAMTLTVEAGKVYYLRTSVGGEGSKLGSKLKDEGFRLKLVDSANGPLKILSFAYSTSHPKKPAKPWKTDSD